MVGDTDVGATTGAATADSGGQATLRAELERQLMTADQLRGLLDAAGCPTVPGAIKVTQAQLRESYWLERTIRSRCTVLDQAYETGVLDGCVAELFAPGGAWAR